MSAPEQRGLHVDRLQAGPAHGAPGRTVLVHGFTQNGRCWDPFDRLLADHGPVDAVDLPGHGLSPAADGDLTWAGTALADMGTADLHVGYSMGGRVLLHTALSDRSSVRRLVLIGAHPGLESPEDRRDRAVVDGARADRLEAIGLDAFLAEWLALPMFADLDDRSAHRSARLGNDAHALAESLRSLGTGTQDPLWDRLAEVNVPTLVLAGERDERFGRIGRRATATIGANAEFGVVPGVGHAAHLEDPEATASIITQWMSSRSPEPTDGS